MKGKSTLRKPVVPQNTKNNNLTKSFPQIGPTYKKKTIKDLKKLKSMKLIKNSGSVERWKFEEDAEKDVFLSSKSCSPNTVDEILVDINDDIPSIKFEPYIFPKNSKISENRKVPGNMEEKEIIFSNQIVNFSDSECVINNNADVNDDLITSDNVKILEYADKLENFEDFRKTFKNQHKSRANNSFKQISTNQSKSKNSESPSSKKIVDKIICQPPKGQIASQMTSDSNKPLSPITLISRSRNWLKWAKKSGKSEVELNSSRSKKEFGQVIKKMKKCVLESEKLKNVQTSKKVDNVIEDIKISSSNTIKFKDNSDEIKEKVESADVETETLTKNEKKDNKSLISFEVSECCECKTNWKSYKHILSQLVAYYARQELSQRDQVGKLRRFLWLNFGEW